MNQYFKNLRNNIIDSLVTYEENQIILSRAFIHLLEFQRALVSFSYIQDQQSSSYITVVSYIARPQLIIPDSQVYQYIVFVVSVLFFLNILFRVKNKYINAFGLLFNSAAFNCFFEISKGEIQIAVHCVLILEYLFIEFITQESYNIRIINFKQTKIPFIDYLIIIINILLILINTYSNSQTLIYLFAFLLNFCNFISDICHANCCNLVRKSLLINIYIFIFYFGIIEASKYNQNLYYMALILFILTQKIVHKFLENYFTNKYGNITKTQQCTIKEAIIYKENLFFLKKMKLIVPKIQTDKIIYTSILIVINKPFEALVILTEIKQLNLNFLTEIKVQLIYKECIDKINSNIQKEQLQFNRITQASKELVLNDQHKQKIQQLVLESMLDKIQCQNLLLSNQSFETFQKYLNFIQKIIKVKKLLEQQYEKSPSEKTQNILGFFYSEIMNDYLSAYLLFNIVTLSDDKINYDTTFQEVFSNKMIYLIIKQDGNNLIVTNPSQEASELLKIQNESLVGKSILYLIPPGIQQQHNILVEEFFEVGASRFFRSIQKNQLYNSQLDYMENYDFALDISLGRELNFIVFIQPDEIKTMEIILNPQQIITCISYQLAFEFEFVDYIANYIGLHIKKIFPKFPEKLEANNYVENAEIIFDQHEGCHSNRQSSTQSPYHTSYYIDLKMLQENISKKSFQTNKQTIDTAKNQSLTTSKKHSYTDEVINDEKSVKSPKEFKFQNQQLWQPYFLEESNQQNLLSNEQNNLINEFKFEFSNSKISKYNDSLSHQQIILPYQTTKQHDSQNLFLQIPIITQNQQNLSQNFEIKHKEGKENEKQLENVKESLQKKQELVYKIRFQVREQKHQKILLLMLLICIILQIIIQAIQLYFVDSELQGLANDIDLLQIKNLIFQPFESFLITRWTMFNYNAMLQNNLMTQVEYVKLFQFPFSNLNRGFDLLESNYKDVSNRIGIQDFLENTYLKIYTYISTGNGEIYNISLRSSMSILLSYQYDFKMRYEIEGTIISDSPYVYYSYRNYITLKETFHFLNEDLLRKSIDKSLNIVAQTQSIFIICLACLIFIFPFVVHYFIRIQKLVNKYYSLLFHVQSESIHNEISKLKYLVDKCRKDINILFKYKQSFQEKESKNLQLTKQDTTQNEIKPIVFYLNNFFYFFVFILILSITIGNATLTFEEVSSYLQKYPETAQYYKSVSDVGTDIPTMFAQRDLLYNITNIAPFLNESYQEQILEEIIDALNRTNNFMITDKNTADLLISESFNSYLEDIMKSDLCNYLPTDLKNKSASICPIVMESNMQRGLKAILIYIINYIGSDMEISKFKNRTSYTYLNLEGAFLISNIIREINLNFHQDLIQITKFKISFIYVHNILLIISLGFMIFFIFSGFKAKLDEKVKLAQQIIYVLPHQHIQQNRAFERELKYLLYLK